MEKHGFLLCLVHACDSVQTVQQKLTSVYADYAEKQGVPVHCTIPGAVELVNHDPDNHTMALDMFVSKQVHVVTPETLCQSGFSGWWSPADRGFATADVARTIVRFVQTLPWDGAEGGRLHVPTRIPARVT